MYSIFCYNKNMGRKWVYRVLNKDLAKMQGNCKNCGDVSLVIGANGKTYCSIGYAEMHERMKITSHIKYGNLKYGPEFEEHYLNKPESCTICGRKIKIAYDHNHETGKFRGWLCMNCNTAIGLLSDDPILFDKIAEYLRR